MDILTFLAIIAAVVVLALLIAYGATNGYSMSSLFGKKTERCFTDSEMVAALLKLDDRDIETLFELYKNEFGPGPARYARRTYRKWRSGEVRANRQTFERLLVYMPKVMPFDLKVDVLRHFMEEFSPKDEHELHVTTADWEEKLRPLVEQLIAKAFTAQLPPAVESKLEWLGGGDMVAAAQLLKHSHAEESRIMVSDLRTEFAMIHELLSQRNLKPKVTHVIEFPYGRITLHIKRESS